MPVLASVNDLMQKLTGLEYSSSEQHVTATAARIQRDTKDLLTFLEFLLENSPFTSSTELRSIGSGLIAHKGVNAEDAKASRIAETAEEDEILLYAVQQDGSKDEAQTSYQNTTLISLLQNHSYSQQSKNSPVIVAQRSQQREPASCHAAPEQKHRFFIAGGNSVPILGFKSSKNMNLVKLVLNIDAFDDSKSTPDLEPLLEQYKELFSGIGKIQGKCKIHLKEGVVPTAYPARKVPIAMREKLKQELNRLESLGIIEKVEEPMEWVNLMVLVEKKDGGVRLCIDPVDLNKAIKRPHYQSQLLKMPLLI
ncbi:hypothetical protein QYM36_015335 [Artemia franciscana]|uniref:Uncharacterized protein n=1 Tax=Artemia franciscana TaxID=6661 RepID=A0AA88KZB5_ARTSF|nr:hypothetical protein QYM36_015335 [Artemia franciscana]